MISILGSLISFIFGVLIFAATTVLAIGIAFFVAMRRNLRNLKGEGRGTNAQKKDKTSNRTNSDKGKDACTIATDYEQPLYDDANAEYVDYEEVK